MSAPRMASAMPLHAADSPPQPAEAFLPFTRPTIDQATVDGVAEVLRSGWLSSGPQVKAFEASLSDYFGGRPVRAFNSGTCTMEIALRIAGVKPGDEVITTPLTWVATSNVILEVGAKPVFVDIDPATRDDRSGPGRAGFDAAHAGDHSRGPRRASRRPRPAECGRGPSRAAGSWRMRPNPSEAPGRDGG